MRMRKPNSAAPISMPSEMRADHERMAADSAKFSTTMAMA